MRKKVTLSVIILSMLLCTGAAWAEGRYSVIEAFFEKINVKVNGQPVKLSKESIIYEGSIYVPLRGLAELLGAEVSWNDATRSVSLDFIVDQTDALYSASQTGIYQYMLLQYNQILKTMTEGYKNGQVDQVKDQVQKLSELRKIASDIGDADMTTIFDKLIVSGELMRSGWSAKKFDDFYLAWTIFKTNAGNMNAHFQKKLSEHSDKDYDIIQINPMDNPGLPRN